MSLTNPNESSRLLHKTFQSEQACQTAFINTMREMPYEPSVRVEAFCVSEDELTGRYGS
jgi:hypothetical protein